MSPPSARAPAITVIGDGLAGCVLALCLARRGAAVRLIGAERQTATALSYGALPRGGASRAWRALERCHGPLGWRPSGLIFHDQRAGLAPQLSALTRLVPLPLARVDAPSWLAARRQALETCLAWGHRSALPLLHLGLRDADPVVAGLAARGLDRFRGRSGPSAGPAQAARLPRNVARTR